MSYHELTEKLWHYKSGMWPQDTDSIIRAYLEEKTQEFETYVGIDKGKAKHNKLREILGLTKEPVSECNCDRERESGLIVSENPNCPKHKIVYKENPKEQEVKTWCEHIIWDDLNKSWWFKPRNNFVENDARFCDRCATPRPEPKRLSLAEILSEASKNSTYATGNKYWEPIADAALQVLEEAITKLEKEHHPPNFYGDYLRKKLEELR